MELIEKRKLNESEDAKFEPKPEVHGSWRNFHPWGDRLLICRLPVINDGLIARPDAYTELADRGRIVAASAEVDIDQAYIQEAEVIAKFSKFGAEEINFDDQGTDRFCLVRSADIRGYHVRG